MRVVCVVASLIFTAVAAHAQTTLPRIYVTVNGGAQAGGNDFTDRREFRIDQDPETATAEARHPFKAGALFDGGAGVRLWKGLGVGLSVSHFSASGVAAVNARIPHPFHFNAHREISGDSGAARRTETGVHVQLLYQLPARGRLRTMVFAGPSYLTAKQDLVTDVRYDQSFPYDTATFASAELIRSSGSAVGFNAGADAFWMFTHRFGAGALVRLTRASLEVDAPANRRVRIDAGGLHVAVGGRAMF